MAKTILTSDQVQNILHLYTVEELSIAKISKNLGISSYVVTRTIKENGIEIINKQNALSFNLETDIIPLYEKGISLTKIAKQFGTTRDTLSKHLKKAGYKVINHQNETKFNEHVFDSIDTEEKAYWLGFIYADGYIDFTPLDPNKKSRYAFELSLKGSDIEHLNKFNIFMGHNKNIVKLSYVNYNGKKCLRCRWGAVNKHLWNTLNNLGCTPRKSLTLKFPDKDIFKDSSLIRHFIRGYFDGDGCLSYMKTNHSEVYNYVPICSMLGTFEFLLKVKELLDNIGIKTHNILREDSNAYRLGLSQNSSKLFINMLYNNSNIYLDRKYKRAMFFKDGCRSAEELAELLQSENGESCDANTVLNSEIKESGSV